MTARYAIYYAPDPRDPLWRAGCDWLGRDPCGGPVGPQPAAARGQTGTAALYGLHATLKAPFRLCCPEQTLLDRLAALARGIAPIVLPTLVVDRLDLYPALLPSAPCAALRGLADAMVEGLDACRAPPTAQETARRRPHELGPAGQEMLARWGYPEVFALWRFHITLGPRNAPPALLDAARAHFAPACAVPRTLHHVAVFRQPGPDQPFMLVARQPLG